MSLIPLLAVLSGCKDGPLPTPVPGGSANYSVSLGEEPDFSTPHSLMLAKWWFDYEEVALSGSFADAPPLVLQTETQREGSCRLVGYAPSFCEPGCSGSDVCVEESCESYPTRLDVGTLGWAWPDGELDVAPDDLLSYYAGGSASSYGESALTVGELELKVPAVVAALPDGDWNKVLSKRARDEDASLRWSNPVADARVRLHMTDCVGSHGGIATAEIECEGPDTGELVIAGGFLNLLADGDWTHGECGGFELLRYHAAADPQDDGLRFESGAVTQFFWRPDQS